jgi:hypothetical protein
MDSTQTTLVFKIHKDGFARLKKTILRRSLPVLFIVLTSAAVMANSVTPPRQLDIQTLLVCLVAGGMALGSGFIRGLKRKKMLMESYRLTITNEKLVREQHNTPTVSLDKTAIAAIVKNKNGNILIKGDKPLDAIEVPFLVENYETLENTLVTIKPIETNDKPAFAWVKDHLLPFMTIGLMICVYAVKYKPVVALSGITLITLMGWHFIKTRRSKNVDDHTKRSIGWVAFVLFFVMLTMVYKLGALPQD